MAELIFMTFLLISSLIAKLYFWIIIFKLKLSKILYLDIRQVIWSPEMTSIFLRCRWIFLLTVSAIRFGLVCEHIGAPFICDQNTSKSTCSMKVLTRQLKESYLIVVLNLLLKRLSNCCSSSITERITSKEKRLCITGVFTLIHRV